MVLITGLPYETLSRIFEVACCDVELDRAPQLGKTPLPHPPTVISHVNRYFRQVALTTATIWRRIYLEYDCRTPHEGLLRHLKVCLERARECLLDIEIVSHFYDRIPGRDSEAGRRRSTTDMVIADIMALLLPCSRWRSFVASVCDELSFWAMIELCNSPAPALRKLEVNADPRIDQMAGSGFNPLRLRMPHFTVFQGQALILDQVRLGSPLDLHWWMPLLSNLKTLDMKTSGAGQTMKDCMPLLHSSPRLESLTMTLFSYHSDRPGSTAEAITMDVLRKLVLSYTKFCVLASFLKVVDMPQLHSITIGGSSNLEEESDGEDKLHLYLRSQRYPTLKRLKINGRYFRPRRHQSGLRASLSGYVSEPWFVRLLEGLPAVEELHSEGNVSYGLLRELAIGDAAAEESGMPGPVLLPKLRWLDLANRKVSDVIDFVARRWTLGGGTLRHVMVTAAEYDRTEIDLYPFREVFHFRSPGEESWARPRLRRES